MPAPSLSDILLCAATGVRSDDMTLFDVLRAQQMQGGSYPETTITGIPPIRFKSDETPLTAWTIVGAYGGVGDQTANLYDCSRTEGATDGYFINKNSQQEQALYTYEISYPIPVTAGETYRWTFNAADGQKHSSPTVGFYDSTDTLIGAASHRDEITTFTFTAPSGCTYIRASVFKSKKQQAMLTLGADEIPYVQYGFEIPVTCGSAVQTIYLDAPLGDGDTISMADSGITITPQKGSNTLSIGTAVQPSAVSITGHIRQT